MAKYQPRHIAKMNLRKGEGLLGGAKELIFGHSEALRTRHVIQFVFTLCLVGPSWYVWGMDRKDLCLKAHDNSEQAYKCVTKVGGKQLGSEMAQEKLESLVWENMPAGQLHPLHTE